jgi:hypothetical protein
VEMIPEARKKLRSSVDAAAVYYSGLEAGSWLRSTENHQDGHANMSISHGTLELTSAFSLRHCPDRSGTPA